MVWTLGKGRSTRNCSLGGGEEGEEVEWVQKTLCWKVGSGNKTRFWKDTWTGRNNFLS